MWVISLLTFVVMQLPEGDYVTELIRQAERQVGDDARAYESQMREFYGLDQAGVATVLQVDFPNRDQAGVRRLLRNPRQYI